MAQEFVTKLTLDAQDFIGKMEAAAKSTQGISSSIKGVQGTFDTLKGSVSSVSSSMQQAATEGAKIGSGLASSVSGAKSLEGAVDGVRGAIKKAESEAGGMSEKFKEIGTGALSFLGGSGLLAAAGGIEQTFEKIIEGAKEADAAADGLSIALAKSGLSSADVAKEQKRLGKAAEEAANSFAMPALEVTKLQAKIAGFSGATGGQLDDLVNFSIGASNALQLPAESVAKLLGKAAEPEATAKLKGLGITFDKNATAAEKMEIITAKLGPTIQATKDSTQDAIGTFDRITHTVEEFTIALASGLFDSIIEIVHIFDPFVEAFKKAFGDIGGGFTSIGIMG